MVGDSAARRVVRTIPEPRHMFEEERRCEMKRQAKKEWELRGPDTCWGGTVTLDSPTPGGLWIFVGEYTGCSHPRNPAANNRSTPLQSLWPIPCSAHVRASPLVVACNGETWSHLHIYSLLLLRISHGYQKEVSDSYHEGSMRGLFFPGTIFRTIHIC
jgi:hypothetical protein